MNEKGEVVAPRKAIPLGQFLKEEVHSLDFDAEDEYEKVVSILKILLPECEEEE